jgi:hypothetical protein
MFELRGIEESRSQNKILAEQDGALDSKTRTDAGASLSSRPS